MQCIKITSTFFLSIKLKFLFFGSSEILYFFNTFVQAFPVSKLTRRSPELPPKTTKTLLNFFSPII